MDKLFNAGKEFLESQSRNDNQGQGGQSNRPDGDNSHGGGFQQDDLLRVAQQEATQLAGSSGNNAMFSKIISSIGDRKGQLANEDIDEQDAIQKHQETYQNDAHGDENSLGTAAAMQALKMFDQGQGSGSQSQGAFVGLALSEASKLFDDKAAAGKVADGTSKDSVIQKAGEMALKMYFKSQGESQGGLMGMASKFLQ